MSKLTFTTVFLLLAFASPHNTQQHVPTGARHYHRLMHADLPLYPALTRTLRISGKVDIEVVVEKGSVVDAQIKSAEIYVKDPQTNASYDFKAKETMAGKFLSEPSLANIKTWQFESQDRADFLVTYVYKIEGTETEVPENPKIELDLPQLVKITARPFKPTCNDCTPQAHVGMTRPDTPTTH